MQKYFKKSLYYHLLLSIGLILLISASSFATTGPVYYFGDSLFDTGYMDKSAKDFLPEGQRPVYTTPHGHVAPYYLNQLLNQPSLIANNRNPVPISPTWVSGQLTGNDYAGGGAVTEGKGIGFQYYEPPPLDRQINNFLTNHNPAQQPNADYIIWIGANDILKTYLSNKSKPPLELALAVQQAITKATTNIKDAVIKLHNAGAQHIFVINLPPIGDVPLMNGSDDTKFLGNFASDLFNGQLAKDLLSLEPQGIHIPIFKVNELMSQIIAKIDNDDSYTESGTALTLTNDHDPACVDSKTNQMQLAINCHHWVSPTEREHYLFADGVHPSDTAHHILAIHLDKFITSDLKRVKNKNHKTT